MPTDPQMGSQAGLDSDAPNVADALTAYPSMVARRNPGRSSGADRSAARILAPASDALTCCVTTGEKRDLSARTALRGCTLKKRFHARAFWIRSMAVFDIFKAVECADPDIVVAAPARIPRRAYRPLRLWSGAGQKIPRSPFPDRRSRYRENSFRPHNQTPVPAWFRR